MKVRIKPVSPIILLLLIVTSFHSSTAQTKITDYKVSFGTADYHGSNCLILREFIKEGKKYYLTADPATLNTSILNSTELYKIVPYASYEQLAIHTNGTAYTKALTEAKDQSIPLQDAGITHGFPKEKGITLTIDLCPSHKGLDRNIFTSLTDAFKNIERPVPVALSLTGRFMLSHPDDITWLKNLVSSGQLNITWVNHTYNHHYDPSKPLNQNFLLEKNTDLNFEVLALETLMIENGLLPSLFFRFPGLISDQQLVDRITAYGLIPIGSDAWLAKGQQPQSGSLVLIHGNGNEPVGVRDFINLLKSEDTAVHQKQWLLYDLRTAVP